MIDLDDVHGQVGQDDAERPEEHGPEDERDVGGDDRVDRELADPRPREDPLDDDDTAQEEAQVEPDLASAPGRRRCGTRAARGPHASPTPLARAVRT